MIIGEQLGWNRCSPTPSVSYPHLADPRSRSVRLSAIQSGLRELLADFGMDGLAFIGTTRADPEFVSVSCSAVKRPPKTGPRKCTTAYHIMASPGRCIGPVHIEATKPRLASAELVWRAPPSSPLSHKDLAMKTTAEHCDDRLRIGQLLQYKSAQINSKWSVSNR